MKYYAYFLMGVWIVPLHRDKFWYGFTRLNFSNEDIDF